IFTFLKVFLAMMSSQQVQHLLFPNQLQALIQQKQQALVLQQQHLKEFFKKQQQQIHNNLQLLQQQSSKKTDEVETKLSRAEICQVEEGRSSNERGEHVYVHVSEICDNEFENMKNSNHSSSQQLMFQQLLQLHQQRQQQFLRVQRPVLSSPLSSGHSFSPLTVLPESGLSPLKMQQLWTELTSGPTQEQTSTDDQDSCANDAESAEATGRPSSDQPTPSHRVEWCDLSDRAENAVITDHPAAQALYSHGVCNWPGCETVCENLSHFIKHIISDHTLDDKSTAQCRVQMQVVQQLELQLCKERERLRAMTTHLRLPSLGSDPSADPGAPQLGSGDAINLPSMSPSDLEAPQSPFRVGSCSQGCGEESPTGGAVRRCQTPSIYSLSSENEYELYKNNDIRPPFTYATLIRQAIMETPDRQLTLNEIYTWFTRTFAYFRRNAATWKNAVRHNLSLHKCFVRVENVKGAVWTVDEVEYQRRRSQRITGSATLMKSVSSSLDFGTILHTSFQVSEGARNFELVRGTGI
uniref:Fork-head domain-containing protein n=1 Tax=Tetraodon nigroviridis TaxID=99883 RepID=H3CSS0_TETNG